MTRFFKTVHRKVALPPGTIEFIGEKKLENVIMSLIKYDESTIVEKDVTIEEALSCPDAKVMCWLDIKGLHDTSLLETIGEHYGLHVLVVEDIANTNQRPKIEYYDNYIYLVMKMLDYDAGTRYVSSEQVSLIIGPSYVLSFQEREGDVFEPVRQRIRNGKGRIRHRGADYLAYSLLDAVVDHYYVMLDKLSEEIESLEENLVDNPSSELLVKIHELKREMIHIRKSIWPLREVVSSLDRDESKLIKEATHVYLRDVYDHTIQVIDTVESLRDIISGMQDLYLSSLSNKMNDVMKVLTIIATIFVPLTFVAGIYGMNFEFMPELKWRWGYVLFWIITAGIGVSMLSFFRRRRWL
jgi:magnesium transporter